MELVRQSMRLFGIPHQFRAEVDPRMSNVSNDIGRKFLQNIIVESPKITIIPGKPKYLPGLSKDDKNTTTAALLSGASNGFSNMKKHISATSGDHLRYYDFSRAYNEYMQYVNILCRSAATFLEITETIDGVTMQHYDWRNYRQNASSYSSVAGNLASDLKDYFYNLINPKSEKNSQNIPIVESDPTKLLYESSGSNTLGTSKEDELEAALSNENYIQFYIDPDVNSSESMSNSTTESKLKGAMDAGSDLLKELAFIANSGGMSMDGLTSFTDESMQSLADYISGSSIGNNSLGKAVSKILSVGSNVVKGENVIIPDIYQSSSYNKQYSFTVHLKSPYGTKFAYYLNVIVPLMHLLALGIPKQTSANSYGSPFLVKMDVPGIFTCNMGMVESININKNATPGAWTVDGLSNEVDVTVSVVDLYSDLSMTPQSSPILFVNNASLIEYLAMTCGLSLVTPQLSSKAAMSLNTMQNAITNIPTSVVSYMTEYIDNAIVDWTALTW